MKKPKSNLKITRNLTSALAMDANSHNAATYREWCEAEVRRIGQGAFLKTEMRGEGRGKKEWCHVERKVA